MYGKDQNVQRKTGHIRRFGVRPLIGIVSLTFLLIGVLGETIYAARRDGGPRRYRGFFIQRLAAQLRLSEDQQSQIRQILEEERAVAEPLMRQLRAVHDQLRPLGSDGVFNEAQVRVLAQQQAQTMTELIVAKERTKARVAAVLTPEQREHAKQMLERFHQRMLGGPEWHPKREFSPILPVLPR